VPLDDAWAGLVDDAAVFPPGDAPLHEATAAYAARSAEDGADEQASLVGTFVLKDTDLPLVCGFGGPLSVVVTGGAGQIAGPAGLCAKLGLDLAGIEIALRDLDDLAGNARRVVAAVSATEDLPPDAAVYVEVPLTHVPDPAASRDWLAALDEVAAADLRLKLRTGGLDPAAFPTAATLAAAVDAALDRELPFKCTAGLHHAVRHRADDTGFEHHGFLNLLLATAAAWNGAGREEVVGLLEERDRGTVAAAAREAGADLTSARRWFTSFGCCAVADPLGDLLALGLLGRAP